LCAWAGADLARRGARVAALTSAGLLAAAENASAHHYRGKTAAIIDRYGPGPRVHYHIGLFDDHRPGFGASAQELRAEIVTAQERMLDRAAQIWDAAAVFTGDLLDVGCGLGGGSVYWAQHFGVRVTALTNVAEHARYVRRFAADAGVGDRVRTLVADVGELETSGHYAAAVAVESSCYVPRLRLFRRVAGVLDPGGVFGIEDIFLAQPAWRTIFDAYWKTSIGTVPQYEEAAAQAGLVLEQDQNVTAATSVFWRYSVAWARAKLAESAVGEPERERLTRSIRWHAQFDLGWRVGAYEVRILRFRKRR
jgi:tocopherol O-methyltransferase